MIIKDREQLGSRLREIRIQKGISIRGLAEQAGLTPATIQNIEAGRFSARIDVVLAILEPMNASLKI